jgi:hypothetical protein
MNRGALAESPRTSRSLAMALLRPVSKSTKAPPAQTRVAQLFTRDHLARPLEEQNQNSKRLSWTGTFRPDSTARRCADSPRKLRVSLARGPQGVPYSEHPNQPGKIRLQKTVSKSFVRVFRFPRGRKARTMADSKDSGYRLRREASSMKIRTLGMLLPRTRYRHRRRCFNGYARTPLRTSDGQVHTWRLLDRSAANPLTRTHAAIRQSAATVTARGAHPRRNYRRTRSRRPAGRQIRS